MDHEVTTIGAAGARFDLVGAASIETDRSLLGAQPHSVPPSRPLFQNVAPLKFFSRLVDSRLPTSGYADFPLPRSLQLSLLRPHRHRITMENCDLALSHPRVVLAYQFPYFQFVTAHRSATNCPSIHLSPRLDSELQDVRVHLPGRSSALL